MKNILLEVRFNILTYEIRLLSQPLMRKFLSLAIVQAVSWVMVTVGASLCALHLNYFIISRDRGIEY